MIPDFSTDPEGFKRACEELSEAAHLRFILARVSLGTVGYAHFGYDKPAPGELDLGPDAENG